MARGDSHRWPAVGIAVVVAAASACYSWQPQPLGPRAAMPTASEDLAGPTEGPRSEVVRVVRADGTEIVLSRPFIWLDSIHGSVVSVDGRGSDEAVSNAVRMRSLIPIAVEDVVQVEVRSVSTGQALLRIVGGAIGLVLLVALIFPAPR